MLNSYTFLNGFNYSLIARSGSDRKGWFWRRSVETPSTQDTRTRTHTHTRTPTLDARDKDHLCLLDFKISYK